MKHSLYQLTEHSLAWLILILAAIGFNSCFLHYYNTNTTDRTDGDTLQHLVNGNKYFILHANHVNYAFSHVKVNNDNIEGDISFLPEEHTNYLRPTQEIKNRFPVKDKNIVLYEVHLYTQDSVTLDGHGAIPFKHIYRLDAYGLDKAATSGSRVLSIVGITLATALVVGIIAGASDISHSTPPPPPPPNGPNQIGDVGCSPQVYMVKDDRPALAGILYSGAIFAPLERRDYLPLRGVRPADSALHLQIRMGANEEMLVHEAKLLRVSHNDGDNVLVDRHGKVWAYRQPAEPETVSTGNDQDVKQDITAADGRYYSFTNHPAGGNHSDIELNFRKPVDAQSGKLVIRARNSPWGLYIFRKFKSLYGDSYPAMQQRKDKADANKLLQCELDQSMPLSVSVKEGTNWKFIDYFFTPGNDAARDMIMNIDLAALTGSDHVQIRLQTTFMFWDLDYAGMDFSEGLSCQYSFLPAISILKSDSATRITQSDPNNMHITDKERLDLEFALTPSTSPGIVNSWFLVGSGYYHDNTPFKGGPQILKLAAFASKGAFDKFSRQCFAEFLTAIHNSPNEGDPNRPASELSGSN
ncbi:MAG TPA: hypothetical protein VNU72_08635 [Puia sp.]|nr:hypothetical protein [Puia sp.]